MCCRFCLSAYTYPCLVVYLEKKERTVEGAAASTPRRRSFAATKSPSTSTLEKERVCELNEAGGMSLPLAFCGAAIMVAEKEEDPRGRGTRSVSSSSDPSLPMETPSPSCCTAAATVGFPGRGALAGERERESSQKEKHHHSRTEGGGGTHRRRRLVAMPLVARNGSTVAEKHAGASKLTGNTTLPLFWSSFFP
ncbi:uncharacterized protein DS421_18g620610 [Arachis hypogaea]|nr:uncharacterized protein DS421_18g620610 [Arachis hypogaea]